MTTRSTSIDGLADWSDPVPLVEAVLTAPKLPGVYIVYCGDPQIATYVGMAGERGGAGLRARLRVYWTGKGAVSGFGEAAFDRALADVSWLSERMAEAEAGEPLRAKAVAALAVARLQPQVRWATTADRPAAQALEEAVLSALPGLWNRRPARGTSKARPGAEPVVGWNKADYLREILEAVRPGLTAAGFCSMYAHRSGSYLHVAWPTDLWIREFSQWIDIKVTSGSARVPFYVRNLPSREANTAAMRIIEDRYAAAVEQRMPTGTRLDWYVGGGGVREIVRAQLDGAGYADGDPYVAAAWAEQVIKVWHDIVRSDPITDLAEQVDASLPGQGYVAAEPIDDEGA